jgi:DNA-binding MarR family transcriptional regulator
MHDASTLQSWKNTLVDYVRSGEPDLTNRQMALLMLVYLDAGPHTVRGLARALNVSKPVVTRALNRLGALGYLRRQRDDTDKRNIFVARTSEGAEFLAEFGNFLAGGDAVGEPFDRRAHA